jgi:hypothetical protein
MTKDDIQLLYEYDRWANNRVLQAVSALSTEQFARNLGGGFRWPQTSMCFWWKDAAGLRLHIRAVMTEL